MMRISFDLDDTLICYSPDVPPEPSSIPLWWRWREHEPLRLGAVSLLRELGEKHELWIYTTSNREPKQVKRWLGFYGIKIGSVVNADFHARVVRSREWSKLPSHFGIALHVDDEDFADLGARFGFKWFVVSPADLDWADKVRGAVARLEALKSP